MENIVAGGGLFSGIVFVGFTAHVLLVLLLCRDRLVDKLQDEPLLLVHPQGLLQAGHGDQIGLGGVAVSHAELRRRRVESRQIGRHDQLVALAREEGVSPPALRRIGEFERVAVAMAGAGRSSGDGGSENGQRHRRGLQVGRTVVRGQDRGDQPAVRRWGKTRISPRWWTSADHWDVLVDSFVVHGTRRENDVPGSGPLRHCHEAFPGCLFRVFLH